MNSYSSIAFLTCSYSTWAYCAVPMKIIERQFLSMLKAILIYVFQQFLWVSNKCHLNCCRYNSLVSLARTSYWEFFLLSRTANNVDALLLLSAWTRWSPLMWLLLGKVSQMEQLSLPLWCGQTTITT